VLEFFFADSATIGEIMTPVNRDLFAVTCNAHQDKFDDLQ